MANDFPDGLRVSTFRREADENCVLLCCYTASSGNSLSTFWEKLIGPIVLTLQDGADRLYRNVGKELPLLPEERSLHPDEFLFIPSKLSNHMH